MHNIAGFSSFDSCTFFVERVIEQAFRELPGRSDWTPIP